MVTANSSHERRPSPGADVEDNDNNKLHNHLDRLYLDPSPNQPRQQRTLSPTNSRDMHMTSSTVPIYRHGRKFYVSAEEYERIRVQERRQRRTALQKSQNLPVQKSYQATSRSSSTTQFHPVHRSTSHPNDRYGVLLAPHNPPINTTITTTRREPTRPSRSPVRRLDDRDERLSTTSIVGENSPSTAIRSNSSDKILDIRRTPQSPSYSHAAYVPHDFELKRSLSAEMALPQPEPTIPARRPVPMTVADYGMSPISTFSMTPTDQTYTQSNSSKLTSYLTRLQQSSFDTSPKSSTSATIGTGSIFETGMRGSDHVYSVLGTSNRRTGAGVTPLLSQPSSSNNFPNDYYFRDTASGSYSDDNSSSPSILLQRRNTDTHRSRRTEPVVETDDDYQQRDIWTRSTVRSQSSDGLTEKKRVRFADMEGLTLETAGYTNQSRSPATGRLLTRRTNVTSTHDPREQLRPFYNSFSRTTTTRSGESKLATDV